MDLKRLGDRAKDLVDKRGGPEGLKQDADHLREIARGPGSLADKAKAAAAAIKEPGGSATSPAADAATEPEAARAEAKVDGESRGKHAGAGHGGGHGRGRKGGGRGRREGRGDQRAF
jgi:hypothetical protein